MTAALICDGCGRLASDADPTDDDPTRRWWSLAPGPTPGGALLKLTSVIEASADAIEALGAPAEPEPDLEPDEPERHFCGLVCCSTWLHDRLIAEGDA